MPGQLFGATALTLGPLSFAAPWLLVAFAVLPILWWLLRLTPPSPRRMVFPAIRLLFDLTPKEETPDRTPWWLILLRALLVVALILGFAHPVWNALKILGEPGPLLLVIDDGWASAPHWQQMQETGRKLIEAAEQSGRAVLLTDTASPGENATKEPLTPLSPAEAKARLAAMTPLPLLEDRAGFADWLERQSPILDKTGQPNIVWLNDGLATNPADGDSAFHDRLGKLGALTVIAPTQAALPLLALPPRRDNDGITVALLRAQRGAAQKTQIRVFDSEGHVLATGDATFAADASRAEAKLAMPAELRNRASYIVVGAGGHAGAVALLDDAMGQKPIGVISNNPSGDAQPLIAETYYIERALAPNDDLRTGTLETLARQPLAMLILPDAVALTPAARRTLGAWIEAGGMLVRFAGPRLAAASTDDLLPVKLRQGSRLLGGTLSWEQTATLAPFPAESPFAGLDVPADIRIERQVLAEPDIALGGKTWARLTDGTPLVTAASRGKGRIVLFHTTANAAWSNLVLSGLFVQMLERLTLTAAGIASDQSENTRPLAPDQVLDGFGKLITAQAGALALSPLEITKGGGTHLPGFYGVKPARRALNLGTAVTALATLDANARSLSLASAFDLKPWLLVIGLLLFIADFLISLILRGFIGPKRAWRGGALSILFLGLLLPHEGGALAEQPQSDMPDADIIAATETTHLAYVRTGAAAVDAISKAGLEGLTAMLLSRTSADIGGPLGVDLENDILAFYPLLYWPVTENQGPLSERAAIKLNQYLAAGGLIFFDTADQNTAGLIRNDNTGSSVLRLQAITRGLDIPPLAPIAPDHVLTRSFYLLKDFPGRWIGGTLWIEENANSTNDGVAGIVVGGNDYAGAWAIDATGQPMFPTTPGGERQRELAYRFGINLVMYALTGNYKSDQVHVPAILERLGQ